MEAVRRSPAGLLLTIQLGWLYSSGNEKPIAAGYRHRQSIHTRSGNLQDHANRRSCFPSPSLFSSGI